MFCFVFLFIEQYPHELSNRRLEVLCNSADCNTKDEITGATISNAEFLGELFKREIPSCDNEFAKDNAVLGHEEISDLPKIGFEDTTCNPT